MRRFSKELMILLIVGSMMSLLAWTDEAGSQSKQKKIYLHPHAVHAEFIGPTLVEFSLDEINNWPGFFRVLQAKLNTLPLGEASRMVIKEINPDNPSNDQKIAALNEINRLLPSEQFYSSVRQRAAFRSETKQLESVYRRSRDHEDLRWLNRSILIDLFPQLTPKGKITELHKMTCMTCHESYASAEKEIKAAGIDEQTVMECFSMAIKNEKPMEDCIEKANRLKKSRIEDYGPLKNFVQRSNPEGQIPLLAAVHPEDPYTFKSLLKKLICLECHGQERKVTKIKGTDGKMKEIPLFYGLGIKKR